MTILKIIDNFRGEYFFLSNFYEIPILINGVTYKSSEHYYQSQKTLDINYRNRIINASTPSECAKLGRSKECPMRIDWDILKFMVMDIALHAKFYQHLDLAVKLLDTEDIPLIEGNHWGDTIWGKVDGIGENWLGIKLMALREELKSYVKHIMSIN
jgi:ribA/ribD-fused uncharacterized protein